MRLYQKTLLSICSVAILVAGASLPTQADTPQESGFSESIFANNSASLGDLTDIAWAPDGSNRLFVLRQSGQLRIIKSGAVLSTPFASVSAYAQDECGADGFCFDPNFVVNKFVYMWVAVSNSKAQIIRFTANGDVGTNKTIILDNIPAGPRFHNGGGMAFGADGKLYAGVGDGQMERGANSNLSSMGSKILRMNPNGTVLADNPFNDGSGPNNDYIWARGFRNPFKIIVRPGNGQMWVNVAGEVQEQAFLVTKGGHGGWSNFEGDQPTGFLKPKIKYPSHASSFVGSTGAITGGQFYDSTLFPASHRGNYFFTDFNSNVVMRSVVTGDTAATPTKFVTGISRALDIATGPDGALYYAEQVSGVIRRLSHSGGGQSLVVTPTWLNMVEGGQAVVMVRLKAAPASNVTVNVMRTAGDSDISVSSGGTLTFTPSNFATPQKVTVSAATDSDFTNDTATLTVSASGITSQTVTVNAADLGASATPSLIVSKNSLVINEGSSGTFTVKLSAAPSANVSVHVIRSNGDPDIGVPFDEFLIFTPTNFDTPQTATVSAAQDADTTDDQAEISVSASGMATRLVSVTAIDDDALVAPTIITNPNGIGVFGQPYTYDVDATGNPTPTFSLTQAPPGMTIDSVTGVISWTPNSGGNFPVTVVASNGVSPDASQSFVVSVGDSPGDGIEAESLSVEASSGDAVRTLAETAASGGLTVQNDTNAVGDFLTLRIPNLAAGTYTVKVRFKKHPSRGIVQVQIGKIGGTMGNIGAPQDLYSSSPAYVEVTLGAWTPTSTSDKQISFKITGKNASSTGFTQNIDLITLTPQ